MHISDWSSDVCSSDLTYDDQTDNYQQDHYQALYSHQFSSALNANIGLHLTKGRGYYEELKPGEDFSGYGLEDIITGGDTISTTDLIRRRWLDNTFYGLTYSLNSEPGQIGRASCRERVCQYV